MMYVFNIDEFPYVEFGENPKRKIRLVMSPFTSPKSDVAIAHALIPVGGVSEGHIHEECDEIIYFENDGKVVIDGAEYAVKKNSIVLAPRGAKHECINTSGSEDLKLLCVFVPPFKPYGRYPELIEATKRYLERSK